MKNYILLWALLWGFLTPSLEASSFFSFRPEYKTALLASGLGLSGLLISQEYMRSLSSSVKRQRSRIRRRLSAVTSLEPKLRRELQLKEDLLIKKEKTISEWFEWIRRYKLLASLFIGLGAGGAHSLYRWNRGDYRAEQLADDFPLSTVPRGDAQGLAQITSRIEPLESPSLEFVKAKMFPLENSLHKVVFARNFAEWYQGVTLDNRQDQALFIVNNMGRYIAAMAPEKHFAWVSDVMAIADRFYARAGNNYTNDNDLAIDIEGYLKRRPRTLLDDRGVKVVRYNDLWEIAEGRSASLGNDIQNLEGLHPYFLRKLKNFSIRDEQIRQEYAQELKAVADKYYFEVTHSFFEDLR